METQKEPIFSHKDIKSVLTLIKNSDFTIIMWRRSDKSLIEARIACNYKECILLKYLDEQ